MSGAKPAQLDSSIEQVVACSRLATMVLAVPTGQIVVASARALDLLQSCSDEAVGRPLSDFTAGGFDSILRTLLTGDVTALETHRTFVGSGTRQRFWMRVIPGAEPVSFALVVVSDDSGREPQPWRLTKGDASLRVLGAVDGRMIVDRIAANVERWLGHRAEDITGTSLFLLIDQDDISSVLLAMARMAGSGESVSIVRLRAVRADQSRVLCRLVLVPMLPIPSFAFALLPILGDRPEEGEVPLGLMRRLASDLNSAGNIETSPVPVRHKAQLTAREEELVARLLAGDRVPAIAESLYLSQGTVRNQLSTLYAKLGINSQQQLIALLRG